MEHVEWKVKLFDADATKVYEEIGEKNTTPEEILQKAENPDSELHKCFEWDDAIAGHKYRLSQARQIMCNLVFVTDDEEDKPRVFYQITTEKSEYHPTKLIMQKPDEYALLLKKAKDELQAFKNKYKTLKELHKIFEAIDEL